MRVPSHPTQIRRMRDSRLKHLAPAGPVLAVTLARVNKRCGQPTCSCHHGGPLHQAHHLVFRQEGKTHTVYVPRDLLDEVQKWVQEHQRLKALIQEISQLNLALIRGHVRNQQRRRGRH